MFKTKSRAAFFAVAIFVAVLTLTYVLSSTTWLKAATKNKAANASASVLDNLDTVRVTEDTSSFTNPEKGWFLSYESDDMDDMDQLRSQGVSLILLKVNLKNFVNSPISSAKLNEIDAAFDAARDAGVSVIFRAAYDYDGVKNPEPKNMSTIEGHIAQLKSVLYANEDVLYCVQAGFLGPWGEWHHSYYGNPPTLDAQKRVLSALMDAVPKSRAIQIRRPMFIRDLFENTKNGSELTENTAFSGSDLARTGYHDDALLSTEDEEGTYIDEQYTRQDELNWSDNQNRYVPFGGESCLLTSNSDPTNAIYELNKLHAQFINTRYLPDVLTKWKATTYQGVRTYDYIAARLGYRFLLDGLQVSKEIAKGGVLHIKLSIRNDGFANPINTRGLEMVLTNGNKTYTAKINEDPRTWYRENGSMSMDWYFSIPSDINTGSWNIALNLPSTSSSLKNNPNYSIRLANTGVWDAGRGYNYLKKGMTIQNVYSNTVTSFRQISRADAQKLTGATISQTVDTTVKTTAQPTTYSSPVPQKTHINSVQVSNDAASLIIRVNGNNLDKKSQFFINTDSSTNTGMDYKWQNGGFDYLVENWSLYRYTGDTESWSWTKVDRIGFNRTDDTIEITVPLSLLGLSRGDTIQMGFISNDDRTQVYPDLSGSPARYILK